MKNYVSLDIENPNTRGNSICSIGIIVIKNNEVVDKIYSLIDPEDRFDIRNSKINGIDASKVQGSPTFPEFWSEICEILSKNVIVGHNITYDLTVISNSLIRYGIDVPEFRYYDTLQLSQAHIDLESYKLSSIANKMHVKHDEHNALSDAMVAYQLFEFLNQKYSFEEERAFIFTAENSLRDNLDARLSTNINELIGIIEGIKYDRQINEFEIARLITWIKENEIYRCYRLFDDIITDLKNILEDGIIDKYEYLKLFSLTDQIKESRIYTKETLDIQVLRGILDGIISDNEINKRELLGLQSWLNNNDYLSDVYPYDKVLEIVSSVLADGKITKNELEQLKQTFTEIINPGLEQVQEINIEGKTFCLTGDFKTMSKREVGEKLKSKGGIEKSSVVKDLDYLFVGELGSDAWKYGKLGAKIVRAQELQEKGASVQIIPESKINELLSA